MQEHLEPTTMLTVAKLDLYQRYLGDIDAWVRKAHRTDRSEMTDADWMLIERLIQGLQLVANGRATPEFAESMAQEVLEVTADEAARRALRALVK